MMRGSRSPSRAALGSVSTKTTAHSLPSPSERRVSSPLDHLPGYCLLTSSAFEALSSELVPTAHRRDKVGEEEEVRIKERKCKSVWHVGRGVIPHASGKFTTIPLLPPHPQLVLKLFHIHLSAQ